MHRDLSKRIFPWGFIKRRCDKSFVSYVLDACSGKDGLEGEREKEGRERKEEERARMRACHIESVEVRRLA